MPQTEEKIEIFSVTPLLKPFSTRKMLELVSDLEKINRMPKIDYSHSLKLLSLKTSKRTLKNVFNVNTSEEIAAVKQAAISGKINLNDYGIDPSPVSGELGHGLIGSLSGPLWRGPIVSINQKD